MKRNILNQAHWPKIDRALGTTAWRKTTIGAGDVVGLIDVFKSQLVTLGYTTNNVRSVEIKNDKNVTLYYLVFASRSGLADKIWESITKTTATGQRSLF
jgi:hypothetical protein